MWLPPTKSTLIETRKRPLEFWFSACTGARTSRIRRSLPSGSWLKHTKMGHQFTIWACLFGAVKVGWKKQRNCTWSAILKTVPWLMSNCPTFAQLMILSIRRSFFRVQKLDCFKITGKALRLNCGTTLISSWQTTSKLKLQLRTQSNYLICKTTTTNPNFSWHKHTDNRVKSPIATPSTILTKRFCPTSSAI